ncbi:MalY/PatB family protein [Thiomicrorhabdus arctica]|uniref:MalY/PatB family protein n=1 Tax=Thiomicrorhabdus arctica TaxID=131540 RepID=UPI0003691571|nr:PatB family C-S lyase [Thiomicrorhabdus arctica]
MQAPLNDFNDELNQTISREGSYAEKYALREALFGTEDVLPMWVADMDLPTPSFILDALKKRLQHPLLGYTVTPEPVYQAIIDWQAHHHYHITTSQIVFTHNVANGFHMAVSAFTQPGDSVLVQPPIYPPFLQAPKLNDRTLVETPLVRLNHQYQIDFAAFETAIVDNQVKLFLFCNPHNPVGRVWLRSELEQIAEICVRHNVIIVSDEIHSDLVYDGQQHVPIASLSPEVANITVTLSSPGKTFNLGGLQIGYALIANPQLKTAYLSIANSVSIHNLNLFAMIALQSAYSKQGFTWKEDLLKHFTQNLDTVENFVKEFLPLVTFSRPQASYLIWLDFREMFDDQETLKNWLVQKAKLGLNDGLAFGEAGKGFMRMNIAVSKPALLKALKQLETAASAYIR